MAQEPEVVHFRPSHIGQTGLGDIVIVEEEEYAAGPTLAEDLGLLAEEAKAYAQAEFAFQKSRAVYAASESRKILELYLLAFALAFCALMALVLGTVIALGPLLTPWGAMAVVTGVLVLGAWACRRSVSGRMRRIVSVASPEEPS